MTTTQLYLLDLINFLYLVLVVVAKRTLRGISAPCACFEEFQKGDSRFQNRMISLSGIRDLEFRMPQWVAWACFEEFQKGDSRFQN